MIRAITCVVLFMALQGCASQPSIHTYASEGDIAGINRLAKSGANLDVENTEGYTPLMMASFFNYKSIQPLLDAGANPNFIIEHGITALAVAVINQPEGVAILLKGGANVGHVDSLGSTALTIAIRHRQTSAAVIPVLISFGADVSRSFGPYGNTPLTEALLHQSSNRETLSRTLELLFKAGADASQKNSNDTTALDVIHHEEIRSLFTGYRDVEQLKKWELSRTANTLDSYNLYLSSYPKGQHKAEAKSTISEINRETERLKVSRKLAKLKSAQACSLRDPKWLYLSKASSGRYANGSGKAKNLRGLTFVGTFKNGYRVKGEIFADGRLMYDGSIKGGKPHGSGVCV